MTVKDYMKDMISGQSWAVEVHTTLIHDSADIELSEGVWKTTESFEEDCINIFRYIYPPLVFSCPFDNYPVKFFRVVNNEIILVVYRDLLV